MSTGEKFVQMFIAIGLFFGVVAVILLLTQRLRSATGERIQSAAFVLPAVAPDLRRPALPGHQTIYQSFRTRPATSSSGWTTTSTSSPTRPLIKVLRNTAVWVILMPLLSTGDRPGLRGPRSTGPGSRSSPRPDLHADGDLARRRLDHLEVRLRLPADVETPRSASPTQLLKALGFDTYRFLLTEPWNTLFLIVIMIWVQAGFAMTILSASIKAIPDDIVEAARLDGASGLQLFRHITVPSIRPSLIVVLTTISIATLKVFDIVRTTTGGNFDTSVLAYEFYAQSFGVLQPGPRRRARGADLHPGDADRDLQRPSDAQAGGPMTTADPTPTVAVEAVGQPRRRASGSAAQGAHLALGIARRDRHRACSGRSRPPAC